MPLCHICVIFKAAAAAAAAQSKANVKARHATGQQERSEPAQYSIVQGKARASVAEVSPHTCRLTHTDTHLRDSSYAAHKSRFALVGATISGRRLSKT